MSKSRAARFLTAVFFIGLTALFAVGCSKNDDIQLKGSNYNPAPPSKPTEESESPATSGGDPTSKPPGTSVPGSTPDPASVKPLAARYRVLCEAQAPQIFTAISSLATPLSFGSSTYTWEVDAQGKFDATKPNLEFLRNPIVVNVPSSAEMNAIFAASRIVTGLGQPPRVFVGNFDLPGRVGRARDLGEEVPAASAAKVVAEKKGVLLRSYGASDRGSYLLFGRTQARGGAFGYEFLDAKTRASRGLAQVGSGAASLNPEYFEADQRFLVTAVNGSAFETKIYRIAFDRSGEVQSSKMERTISSLQRPLQRIPTANAGDALFSAMTVEGKILVYDANAGTFARMAVAVPPKGRLSSATAVWQDGAKLFGAIVYEDFRLVTSPGSATLKIDEAFVRVLELDTKTGTSKPTADIPYPGNAIAAIETKQVRSSYTGVSDLRAAPGGGVFALFPGISGQELYRLSSSGLDPLTQDVCASLSIGVEP